MTGKLLALSIILAAMVAGISIYYLQIYAFYDEVVADGGNGCGVNPAW